MLLLHNLIIFEVITLSPCKMRMQKLLSLVATWMVIQTNYKHVNKTLSFFVQFDQNFIKTTPQEEDIMESRQSNTSSLFSSLLSILCPRLRAIKLIQKKLTELHARLNKNNAEYLQLQRILRLAQQIVDYNTTLSSQLVCDQCNQFYVEVIHLISLIFLSILRKFP